MSADSVIRIIFHFQIAALLYFWININYLKMVVLSSFPPPTEGIKLVQPNTGAYINTRDLGQGTLYIAERFICVFIYFIFSINIFKINYFIYFKSFSRVSWVSATSGQGFSLEYPHISLHAVSKDPSAFPLECLYLMLDSRLDEPGNILFCIIFYI
jgi:nucleotide-sensitive chloride channel 1A